PSGALADAAMIKVNHADGSVEHIVRDTQVDLATEACRPGVRLDPAAGCLVPPQDLHAAQAPVTAAGAPAGPGGATVPQNEAGGSATPAPQEAPAATPPASSSGQEQRRESSRQHASEQHRSRTRHGVVRQPAPRHVSGGRTVARAPRLRHSDGSPARSNPSFFDALPGPAGARGVPNFVIQKFRVPIFLLPIYQAAGTQYGIRWEVLAAINEIETDYGRNLNVSSAGALGWMQFMPATWRTYGVDANKDGRRDPYNPVDAIFAAAKYLKAAGGQKDIRRGIFAYNHAGWYVDSVMLRAKLLAGVPVDVVGSLTGLTEGRFPVAAHARYADNIDERTAVRRVKHGNAANVVKDDITRHLIEIYSAEGAPIVAVNDGQVQRIAHTRKLGDYVVLQDVYGNQYTYSGLGSVEKYYPVPKKNPGPTGNEARAIAAHSGPRAVAKRRVFAHPAVPAARQEGGLEQMFDEQAANGGFSTHSGMFTPNLGLNARNSTLRKLRPGARVIAGTLLGRVGRPEPNRAAHMNFAIRPAGKGAPRIDPKPILDGWKLLESTAVYRAHGKNVLKNSNVSIGQILMMPKAQLEKRVLGDDRIKFYPGGREDIRTGQIDRRVLAVLEFLAESGLNPTVSSLKGNHGYLTASGNVSEHSSGNAVDISAVNGIPILGHQDKGGITEQTVRRLMTLQGTMQPHQIISLLSLGRNSLSMSDHYNHIHVGFHPMFGSNDKKLGKQAQAVLKPGQWTDLIGRLRQIENPVVPTRPSRYSLPVERHSRHHGHGDGD
ncbi:MAG TPA: lytic murein transglycosylase, partial [Thermoleophilaceae bacterium]